VVLHGGIFADSLVNGFARDKGTFAEGITILAGISTLLRNEVVDVVEQMESKEKEDTLERRQTHVSSDQLSPSLHLAQATAYG
jgi:hypothetical protein